MSFINPTLPVADVRRLFDERGSAVIHNFLMPEVAARLKTTLKALSWNLAVSDQGKGRIISAEAIAENPSLALQATEKAWSQRDGFSFAYHNFDLIDAIKSGQSLAPELQFFVEQMNTPEFHALLTRLTGLTGFTRVSAQLTNYRPGDFLTMHNDHVPGETRYCAYVMSLADPWQSEWGGKLHLYTDDEQTETRSVLPRFNSIALFRTPQKHLVSRVSENATGERISITGWLSCPND